MSWEAVKKWFETLSSPPEPTGGENDPESEPKPEKSEVDKPEAGMEGAA